MPQMSMPDITVRRLTGGAVPTNQNVQVCAVLLTGHGSQNRFILGYRDSSTVPPCFLLISFLVLALGLDLSLTSVLDVISFLKSQ